MSPGSHSSPSRALQPERGAGAALMQIYDAPSLSVGTRLGTPPGEELSGQNPIWTVSPAL